MLVFVELAGAGERGCVRRVGGAQPGHRSVEALCNQGDDARPETD